MRKFALFLLTGGIAASLNWSSRFAFSLWMPYEYAVVCAFFVGLISGFVLMRWYVFEGKEKPVIPQVSKYIVVNLFALAQTLVISVCLVKWGLPAIGIYENTEALAHLVGVLFPVITSFFGHRFLTFR